MTGATIQANKRLEEASDWFMRLREEPVTTETITEWSQWCEAHADNMRCYREVQQLWTLAGDAGVEEWPAIHDVAGDAYDGERSVQAWKHRSARHLDPALQQAAPEEKTAESPVRTGLPEGKVAGIYKSGSRKFGPRRARWALAASVAVAMGAWIFWSFNGNWGWDVSAETYSSARGEKRQVPLSDGSVLTLGGASAVRVSYNDERRELRLQRGEAFFKVARDPRRPFVVTAPNLQVTAIGTAFTVRADDTRTVVSVTEGLVEVAQAGKTWRAAAGKQISYDVKTTAPVVSSGDIAVAMGWQDGALTYVDEPLRSVVARVNRYSMQAVTLSDPQLGELRFTGTIFENQVQEWASGLERVFPVRVQPQADGSLQLAPLR